MYNIIFASVPILWYALYDFEYEKEEFLRNPAHFIVGLKHMLFSNFVFWQWFIQGATQAFVLLAICFVSQGMTTLSDGTNFDFWLTGQVLYLSIVLIVNLKIVQGFNVFNGVGELTVFVMIANFFWFYALENSMEGIHTLYRTLPQFFSAGSQMWLCAILCVGYIFTMDKIITYAWRYAQSRWKHSKKDKRRRRHELIPSGPMQTGYQEFNDEK
jgi:magnesium-transporting ATPase (P-type)